MSKEPMFKLQAVTIASFKVLLRKCKQFCNFGFVKQAFFRNVKFTFSTSLKTRVAQI